MNATSAQAEPSSLISRLARKKGLVKFLTQVNVGLYRLSGGRLANQLEGCPVCLVTMTGAKSGQRKTIALMYMEHGEDVLLGASMGGAPKHPVWYYNLKAHPDIQIQIGRRKRQLVAREAADEEHARLWPVLVSKFAPFAEYQRKTTRRIPIFVCSPKR